MASAGRKHASENKGVCDGIWSRLADYFCDNHGCSWCFIEKLVDGEYWLIILNDQLLFMMCTALTELHIDEHSLGMFQPPELISRGKSVTHS